MEKYLHESDALIDRGDDPDGPGAKVYSCDGDHYFTFPATMSDAEIMIAIRFANQAYVAGVRSGDARRLRQVQMAMGLEL